MVAWRDMELQLRNVEIKVETEEHSVAEVDARLRQVSYLE